MHICCGMVNNKSGLFNNCNQIEGQLYVKGS